MKTTLLAPLSRSRTSIRPNGGNSVSSAESETTIGHDVMPRKRFETLLDLSQRYAEIRDEKDELALAGKISRGLRQARGAPALRDKIGEPLCDLGLDATVARRRDEEILTYLGVAADHAEGIPQFMCRPRQGKAKFADDFHFSRRARKAHRARQIDHGIKRDRQPLLETADVNVLERVAQRQPQIDAARVRLAQICDLVKKNALPAGIAAAMRADDDPFGTLARPIGNRGGPACHGAGTAAKIAAQRSRVRPSCRNS